MFFRAVECVAYKTVKQQYKQCIIAIYNETNTAHEVPPFQLKLSLITLIMKFFEYELHRVGQKKNREPKFQHFSF
jgi:hypothetical protein